MQGTASKEEIDLVESQDIGKDAQRSHASTATALQLQRNRPKATRITKLVLDGFKSFGKRTELLFDEGFNVIVGPNGSGKSNVTEAICFVLGRSSAKSLRAERASSFIYNGGKTKQPAKQAEVSLFFDNSSKVFPVNEDEVKITRIVGQDGQSKYKINGKTRTRQELLELLAAAKIDPNGYNLILQGDIVRFVEMSPIERRQLVEDIAGIGIYEEKKAQALNELAKVEEKLGHAEIILKERDAQLKELKKDRDQALRYKSLSDKIKQNKATFVKKLLDAKQAEADKLTSISSGLKEKLERLNIQISKIRNELSEKKARISQINLQLEQKGEGEQAGLRKEIERLKVELAEVRTKITSLSEELARMSQRKAQLEQSAESRTKKIAELEEEKKELLERKAVIAQDLDTVNRNIIDFKKKNELPEDIEEVETKIATIDRAAEIVQSECQKLVERQQALLREKDKLDFQLQTINSQIAKFSELANAHKAELEALNAKKEEFKRLVLELNKLLNEDSQLASQIVHLRSELIKAREEFEKIRIRSIAAQEESSPAAVKAILKEKEAFGKVFGTIAELGEVDSSYALALETVAGSKLNSIVVDNERTAANCIKFLKDKKLGTASFLPLNKIKNIKHDEGIKKLLGAKGVHGLAIDLISFDPAYKAAFSYVFGNTIVVDDIETARRLGIGSARMVTLDGDLCESSGVMIGGFAQRKGAFTEKRLTEELARKERIVAELTERLELAEKARQAKEAEISRLREKKAMLEGEIIKGEKSLHFQSLDIETSTTYKEELKLKLEELSKELASVENALSEKTSELTKLKVEKQKFRNKIAELKNPAIVAQLNAFELKRRSLLEEMAGLEARFAALEATLAELFSSDAEKSSALLKAMDSEMSEMTLQISSLKARMERLTEELKAKESAQASLQSSLKELFDERNKLSSEVITGENAQLEIEEVRRKLEIELNTISIEEARIVAELNNLQAEFSQYVGVELLPEKSEEELKKEIAEFERMVSEIGPINMRALDIYELAEKEYQVLVEKKKTLVAEKEEVLRLMNEIEQNKTDLFMNTFKAIEENFSQNFAALTSKGEAHLVLEMPDKPFEGGIDIEVRLTGTKFLDLRSLSGGEKTLTALALIFAIQEHEPASFYVLDEVDAALDRHNSEKLAQLIKKYSKNAQYLMISHNDAIISEASTLYGVSMDEHGISQVVGIKI
ncbi:MAG: chromosome segregation protein SMC [Candidatus Woesearchaeota archaeon]